MEQLYQFLTSVEFRQRIEGVVEAFKTMREDLEAEKRALQKHWARREKQLTHTAVLCGGVQGIVGQNALPDIAPLQLMLNALWTNHLLLLAPQRNEFSVRFPVGTNSFCAFCASLWSIQARRLGPKAQIRNQKS